MPSAFNFAASPFDCLSAAEQEQVRRNVDIAYFREGEVVLERGAAPTHLFIVIKGYVTQTDGDEVQASYGPDDSFDGRGLVAGRVSSRFVAAEEVLAYQLTKEAVQALIASNATFGALLFADLSHKLSALSQRREQHELQSLMLARVDAAFLRPAHIVDAQTDILAVVKLFQTERTSHALVRGLPDGLGIFTTNTLQRAILDGRPLATLAVGEFASAPVITVRPSDLVGDAMALLLRRRVHRLVVVEGEQVVGVLEALDLFSFLSNSSHLITVQIEQASDLDALALAAAQITRLILLLHRAGTRISLMAQLVQQLNARLFERAWHMIAPPELVAHSCLFVMGSEGRGEQLLKTDQDNGLLLHDDYLAPADLDAICLRFSEALSRFGYPECPGHIMLSNPAWRGAASDFARKARQWLMLPDGDSLMHLAIFMDAHAVAGDGALLEGVRSGLLELAGGQDVMVARFAAAVDAFGSPSAAWWSRWLSHGEAARPLNLKKEGIFPIVHGVRSLALAQRIEATGTVARIEALVARGALDALLGDELRDSLYVLMRLRLQSGLADLDADRPVSGDITLARLSSLERDLLKDTLVVVRRFKALLHQRFRLDAV